MNNPDVEQILDKAAEKCSVSGNRFTEKRKHILSILVRSAVPLSAYEVADAYSEQAEAKMPVMSVYRILDFLEQEQFVHKLNSTNKYVACSHIHCGHTHGVPQFLICSNCQAVKEITVGREIIAQLEDKVEAAGYHLTDSHLELQCLCDKCRAA